MHRSSESMAGLATALAKAQVELINPEKSLIANTRQLHGMENPRNHTSLIRICSCMERHRVAATKPIFDLSQPKPAWCAVENRQIRITYVLRKPRRSAARSVMNSRSRCAAATTVSSTVQGARANGGVPSDLIRCRSLSGFGMKRTGSRNPVLSA